MIRDSAQQQEQGYHPPPLQRQQQTSGSYPHRPQIHHQNQNLPISENNPTNLSSLGGSPESTIQFGNLPLIVCMASAMPYLDIEAERPLPPLPRAKLPYKTHPLYRLRVTTLWCVAGTTLLTLIVQSSSYYWYDSWAVYIGLLLSFLFVLSDLVTWALSKVEELLAILQEAGIGGSNDSSGAATTAAPAAVLVDHHGIIRPRRAGQPEYSWPMKKLVVVDFLFALLFLYMGLMLFIRAIGRYNYAGEAVLTGYLALALALLSVLHAVAFWKELMARKKQSWLKKFEKDKKKCSQCGHGSVDGATAQSRGDENQRATLPRWETVMSGALNQNSGPAAASREGDDSETSLLLQTTPDESNSSQTATLKAYGTLTESVRSLNSDVEELVKKKSKRRTIGEDWMDEGSSRV